MVGLTRPTAAPSTTQKQSPSGKPSGSIELELQLVSLEDDEEMDADAAEEREAADADELAGAPAWGPGPKSVLEDIDWNELGQMMGGKAMDLGRFQFECFLTNEVRLPVTMPARIFIRTLSD